jgi:TolA-binding protein
MKKLMLVLLLGVVLAGCDFFDKAAINEYEAATKSWNAGDYQNAVRQYFTLVKEHPTSSRADDALYWAGVTQFLYLGETEKALQTLRLLLKQYPHRDTAPAAQWYIAQIYELGYSDYERAIEEYRKAADYSNREVREKSLYSLADNLFRLGKRDEARDVWMRQVAEFSNGPQSRLAFFRLGTTAFSKGEIHKAEEFYRKTLENSTDQELSTKAKFALAGCFEADDNLTEALKLYREIEHAYSNPEAIQIKIKALETRIIKKSY